MACVACVGSTVQQLVTPELELVRGARVAGLPKPRLTCDTAVRGQKSPLPRSYKYRTEFSPMGNQGGGTANALVTVVAARGCRAGDFDGFVAGNIALIKRGNCTFHEKVALGQAAGAAGILIYNDGDAEDRTGVIHGTLGEPPSTIPVFGMSFGDGQSIALVASLTNVTAYSTSQSTECPCERGGSHVLPPRVRRLQCDL